MESLYTVEYWWGCKLVQPLLKSVWRFLKKLKIAKCWWLTPIILATQEAEIRRIKVRSQSQ
jgi:hypothetical protein